MRQLKFIQARLKAVHTTAVTVVFTARIEPVNETYIVILVVDKFIQKNGNSVNKITEIYG